MKIAEKIGSMKKEKKTVTAVMILGIGGLLLIMLSSVLPEKGRDKNSEPAAVLHQNSETDSDAYCRETEERLEKFLSSVEGAGDVKVYLTIGTDERYVYAKEGKQSRSENKIEEEEKYVIIGGGSEKNALIETIETPEITGAVIACTGCDSPTVRERIYKAVAAALGIPTGKIYVTKLIASQTNF